MCTLTNVDPGYVTKWQLCMITLSHDTSGRKGEKMRELWAHQDELARFQRGTPRKLVVIRPPGDIVESESMVVSRG
jgi:hypothetical protein